MFKLYKYVSIIDDQFGISKSTVKQMERKHSPEDGEKTHS